MAGLVLSARAIPGAKSNKERERERERGGGRGRGRERDIVTSPVEQGITIVAAITILTVCNQQHIGINMIVFKCSLQI